MLRIRGCPSTGRVVDISDAYGAEGRPRPGMLSVLPKSQCTDAIKRAEPWLCLDNEYISSYDSGKVNMWSDTVPMNVRGTYLCYTVP